MSASAQSTTSQDSLAENPFRDPYCCIECLAIREEIAMVREKNAMFCKENASLRGENTMLQHKLKMLGEVLENHSSVGDCRALHEVCKTLLSRVEKAPENAEAARVDNCKLAAQMRVLHRENRRLQDSNDRLERKLRHNMLIGASKKLKELLSPK